MDKEGCTWNVQMSFVSAMIRTVHSCKQYGAVQYFTTNRAIDSKKNKKRALYSQRMLSHLPWESWCPCFLYILFGSAGCLGIHSCLCTPQHWHRCNVYVKHYLLLIRKLEFIVRVDLAFEQKMGKITSWPLQSHSLYVWNSVHFYELMVGDFLPHISLILQALPHIKY